MNKLLTKMGMRARLQKFFFIGLFLIASSIFSLYAQTYNFYMGSSLKIGGESVLQSNSIEQDSNGHRTNKSVKNTETIAVVSGFKLGFRFPIWRASLQIYDFLLRSNGVNMTLAVFDYLHPSGFFVGGGVGTGVVGLKAPFREGIGTVTAINFGFEFELDQQLLVGFGHLYAPSNFKSTEDKICSAGQVKESCTVQLDGTLTISNTYLDITYIF